ncbi:MAG: lipopolysaccharide kinase InaA family protein [bacterium]|nr:lipopolysaccharide kinase InaA family protein [bacterium]
MIKYIKKGLKRGWVKNGYEKLFNEDLDALFHSHHSTIIKDQKRVKVYRVIWKGEPLFIKLYNPYSIGNALEAIFFGSKAVRSWKGAHLLGSRGINTAEPVAAINCQRFGIPGKCFYITKEIGKSEISVEYYERRFIKGHGSVKERRLFIRTLAVLFKNLHQKGIYHNDLKDYNILVRDEDDKPVFFLLDLEGVKSFSKLPRRCLIENLMQVNRTIGRIMSNSDRVAFIKEYCNNVGWKALAKEALAASAIKDRKVGAKRL